MIKLLNKKLINWQYIPMLISDLGTPCSFYQILDWQRCAPTFLIGGGGGGNGMFVPPPPLLTPHFYFALELYVYITLTNNYLAFFIYN